MSDYGMRVDPEQVPTSLAEPSMEAGQPPQKWTCPIHWCAHPPWLHDVEDAEGNSPTCCVDGCDCGRTAVTVAPTVPDPGIAENGRHAAGGWIRQAEAPRHRCVQPEHGGSKGDLWRCGSCGRLWQVIGGCADECSPEDPRP